VRGERSANVLVVFETLNLFFEGLCHVISSQTVQRSKPLGSLSRLCRGLGLVRLVSVYEQDVMIEACQENEAQMWGKSTLKCSVAAGAFLRVRPLNTGQVSTTLLLQNARLPLQSA